MGRSGRPTLTPWRRPAAVAALLLALLPPAVVHSSGPQHPPAPATLLVVAEDLNNDGVLGVGVGLDEALHAIGWQARVVELESQEPAARAARLAAPDLRPVDGVVLLGLDAAIDAAALKPFTDRGIPIVGWHAGPAPIRAGSPGLRVNVATDTDAVAQLAAATVAQQAAGGAGIVIFADPRFALSRRKVEIMVETLADCDHCRILSIEWITIREAAGEVPPRVRALLERHGTRWTHTLAINDVYFDALALVLADQGVPRQRLRNISAGDGSRSAYDRITVGGYQWGTVPEPLLQQGWQLVDEMRRLLAGLAPSGAVAPVVLLTAENAPARPPAGGAWDAPEDYRAGYIAQWRGPGTAIPGAPPGRQVPR